MQQNYEHSKTILVNKPVNRQLYDSFTLTETKTETDKMATVPNGTVVSVQYEHP